MGSRGLALLVRRGVNELPPASAASGGTLGASHGSATLTRGVFGAPNAAGLPRRRRCVAAGDRGALVSCCGAERPTDTLASMLRKTLLATIAAAAFVGATILLAAGEVDSPPGEPSMADAGTLRATPTTPTATTDAGVLGGAATRDNAARTDGGTPTAERRVGPVPDGGGLQGSGHRPSGGSIIWADP